MRSDSSALPDEERLDRQADVHSRRFVAAVLVMCTSLATIQCTSPEGSRKDGVQSIEGRVHLVASGVTTRGTENTVYLVPFAEPLVQNARAICDRIVSEEIRVWADARRALQEAQGINARARAGAATGAYERAIALSDSAFRVLQSALEAQTAFEGGKDERVAREIRELLAESGNPRVTETDENGRYRFADVPEGTYLLFSEWRLGETTNHWLTSVSVSSIPTVRDLDSEAKSLHLCPSQR